MQNLVAAPATVAEDRREGQQPGSYPHQVCERVIQSLLLYQNEGMEISKEWSMSRCGKVRIQQGVLGLCR